MVQEAVALLQSAEPIRIVTKSHVLGIAAAAMFLSVLEGKKCSLRVVRNYTSAELVALQHEDYPSFVLIDCVEKEYQSLKNAQFLSSRKLYGMLPNVKDYAHILVAGYIAEYIEIGGELDIPDNVLQDALQSGHLVAPNELFMQITEKFLKALVVYKSGPLTKLFDFAAVLTACARTGNAPLAIAALLGDHVAQEKAVRVLAEYRNEVANALEWCKKNEKSTHRFSGALIVHMKDYVASYLTGSVATHLVQEAIERNTLILVLAYAQDDWVRVSLRMAGKKVDVNLFQLLGKIFEGIKGECGGDERASGGMFVRKDEEKFLGTAQKILEQAFVEEKV